MLIEYMTTLALSLVGMAGYFLMLWAAVGFIQDKKFFTSAPKDIQNAVQVHAERFKGQHVLGWVLMILALLLMLASVLLGALLGIKNDFSFLQFFIRFLMILWLVKIFDVLFFDLYLLCHSNFFPHYFPEVKDFIGPQQFGFNKKDHVIQFSACILIAALLAFICRLF